MDLNELEVFIKNTTIPKLKKKTLTFQDISGQPHYENVCSNIYAFFFNPSGEHGMGALFINCLVQLINEHKKEPFSFGLDFKINTESGTQKKGRIDLLLSTPDTAIIIENKIFHYLNNDLDDYWDSINCQTKQGVVLSLHKINKIPHKDFINITHSELSACIIRNLSTEFLDIPEKYLVYLKDFFQNIQNLTNPMEEKIIKFYSQHVRQINEIDEIRKKFISHIISEVERSREGIVEKLAPYKNHNESFRYFLCPGKGNLMITIAFDELFKESKKIYFIVELQNEFLAEKEKFREITFSKEEEKYLSPDFYKTNGNWAHFAVQSQTLSEDDILHLSNYIATTINKSPILSIYKKLKEKLSDHSSD